MLLLSVRRRTLLVAFAALLALMLGLSAVAWTVGWLGGPRIERLHVDQENGTAAYLHAALLALIAVLWATAASRERARRTRRAWILLALAAAYVSFDEFAALHEELIEPLRASVGFGGLLWFGWVVPGAAALAVLAALTVRSVLRLPPPVRLQVVAGAALYVAGALGFELLGGAQADASGELTLAYGGLIHAEEGLESAGLLLMVAGLTAFLSLSGYDRPPADDRDRAARGVERLEPTAGGYHPLESARD